MTDEHANTPGYWVEHPTYGCAMGGPFDLWRQNYFLEHGEPPKDTQLLYPDLSVETLGLLSRATVRGMSLDDAQKTFSDRGPSEQVTLAHRYFREWRKRVPFASDAFQDMPLRPPRSSPEPLEEFLEDLRRNVTRSDGALSRATKRLRQR